MASWHTPRGILSIMTQFQQSVIHLITVAIVVAAVVALAILNIVNGATAVALIAASGGISLGVGAVSMGASSGRPPAATGVTTNVASQPPTQA